MLTSLVCTVPPTQEPVDLDSVKRHLHILGSAEDTYIIALIPQCRQELEHVLRKSLTLQTLQAVFTLPTLVETPLAGFIGERRNYTIELVQPPVQSILTVEIEYTPGTYMLLNYSVDPLQTTDYFIQPGQPPSIWFYSSAFLNVLYPLVPNYIAIEGFPSVRITYTAGYVTSPPSDLTGLLLQLVAHRFMNREDMTLPNLLKEAVQGRKAWHL